MQPLQDPAYLGDALAAAVGVGLLVGLVVALFNSWGA